MKALVLAFIFAGVGFSQAQVSLKNPPKPDGRLSERGTGGGSASVGIVPPKTPAAPIIVQITTISPVRAWTNTDGKVITARLVSFTTPPPGQSQPITVTSEGKVRFYMDSTKKTVDYPLEKLSEADKVFVKKLGQAVAKAARSEAEKAKATPK